MAKGNIDEFNKYLKEQVGQPYVWGGQHLKLTPENYESVITRRESDAVYRLQAISYCKARFDMGATVLYAYDCSGLGMYWLENLKHIYSSDMSCKGLWSKCTEVTKPKKGYWVFRFSDGKASHIGFLISDSEVIHSKGRSYGVVKEKYSSSYWHKVGKPSCMDFSDPDPEPTPPSPTPTHEYVKVKRKCRVRAGNGTKYKTLAIAYKGTEYPLIGQDDHDPFWFIIEWKGQQAWITSNQRYTTTVHKA